MHQAYYNDSDPYVCQWLRNLMQANLIMRGEVDDRPLQEVKPSDLKGFTRCHFFAGIAGWEYALQLAGWPEDRPVWTGSCPCQPFSVAGHQKGHTDYRHVWPVFYDLIAKCQPPTIFGEQVASALGREWLAAVRLDLEELAYACGAADLPAAGAGAPHIRQRLWWVADTYDRGKRMESGRPQKICSRQAGEARPGFGGSFSTSRLGNSDSRRLHGRAANREVENKRNPWETGMVICCKDRKARPVEPSILPLADGISNRVGRIRAYGNAIVPQVASCFIQAYQDIQKERERDEQLENTAGNSRL